MVKDKNIQVIQSEPIVVPLATLQVPAHAVSECNAIPLDGPPGATEIAAPATQGETPALRQGEIAKDVLAYEATRCNVMKEVASSSSHSEYCDLSFDAVKDIDKNFPNVSRAGTRTVPHIAIWGEYPSAKSKHRHFESSELLNSCSMNYNSLKQTMNSLNTRKYKDLDMPVEDDNFLPIFPFNHKRISDNKSTNDMDSFAETQPQYVYENTVFNNGSRQKTTDLNSFKNNEDLNMPNIENNHFTYKCMSDSESTQGVEFFAKTQPQHATTQNDSLLSKQVNIIQRRNADGIRKCSRYMVPSSASGKNDIIRLPERKSHLQTNLSSDSDLFVDPIRCIPRMLSLPDELKIVPPREQDDDNSSDARTTKKKYQIPKLKEIPIIPELVTLPKINTESKANNVKNIIFEHRRHFYNRFVPGTREPSVVRLKDRLREDWLQKFVPPSARRRRRKSAPHLLSTVNISHLPPRSDPLKISTKNLAHTSLTKSDGNESLRSRIQRMLMKNKGNFIKKNIMNLGMVSKKPKNAKKNHSSLVTKDFDATSTKTDVMLKCSIAENHLIKHKGDTIKNLEMVSKRSKNPTENLTPLVTKDGDKSPVKIYECPGTLKCRIELDTILNKKDNLMNKRRMNPDKVMRTPKNAIANYCSSVTNDFDTPPVKPDDFSHIPHDDNINTKGKVMKEEIANAGIINSRPINSTANFCSILTTDCDTSIVTGDECPVTQKYRVGHRKFMNSKENDVVEKTIANPCMISEEPKNATENLLSSICKDSDIISVKTVESSGAQDNLVKHKGDVIVENVMNPGIVSGRIINTPGTLPLSGIKNGDKRPAKPVECPVTLKCSIELAKLTKSIDIKIANPDMLSRRFKYATGNTPSLVTNDDTSPAIADEHSVTLKCHIKHHKLINFNRDNINENKIVSPSMVSKNPDNPTENFPSSITKDVHTSPTKTDEFDITDKEITNRRKRPRNDEEYLPSFAIKDCNTSPTQSNEIPVTLEGRVVNDNSIKNKGDIIEENMVNRKIKNELEDSPCLVTKNSITSSANTDECPVILNCRIADDKVIKSTENGIAYDTFTHNIRDVIVKKLIKPDTTILRSQNRTESVPSSVVKYCDQISPLTLECPIEHDKLIKNREDIVENQIANPSIVSGRTENVTEHLSPSVAKDFVKNPVITDEFPASLKLCIKYDQFPKNIRDIIKKNIAKPGMVCRKRKNATENLPSSVIKYDDKSLDKTHECPVTQNTTDQDNLIKNEDVIEEEKVNPDTVNGNLKFMATSSASGLKNIISLPETQSHEADLLSSPELFVDHVFIPRDLSLPNELKIVPLRERRSNDSNCFETLTDTKKRYQFPKLKVSPIIPETMNPQVPSPKSKTIKKDLKNVLFKPRRHSRTSFVPGAKESSVMPLKDRHREESPEKFLPRKTQRPKRKSVQKLKLRISTQLSQRSTSSPITINALPNTTSEKTDTIQSHSAYDKLIKNMGEEIANCDKVSAKPTNAIENSPAVVTENFDINPAKTNVCPVTQECSLALDNLIKNKGDTIDSEITEPGMVSEIPNIGTENFPSLVTKDFVIHMPNSKKAAPPLIFPSRQVQHVKVSIPITEHMRIPKPRPNVRILEQKTIKPSAAREYNENIAMKWKRTGILDLSKKSTRTILTPIADQEHIKPEAARKYNEVIATKSEMDEILDLSKKSTVIFPISVVDQETIKLMAAREYYENIATKWEMVGILDLCEKPTLTVPTFIADEDIVKPIATRKYNEDITTRSEMAVILDLSKKSTLIVPSSVADQRTIKLKAAKEYNEDFATKSEMAEILDMSKKSTLTVPTFIADQETIKPMAARKYNDDIIKRREKNRILDLSTKSTLTVPTSKADQETVKPAAARKCNEDIATKCEMPRILDLSKTSINIPTSIAGQETIEPMVARKWNDNIALKSEMARYLDFFTKSTLNSPSSISDSLNKELSKREEISTKTAMFRYLDYSRNKIVDISKTKLISNAQKLSVKPVDNSAKSFDSLIIQNPEEKSDECNQEISTKTAMFRYLNYSRNTSKEMFDSNAEQVIFKPVNAKINEDISLKKFDSTIIKPMNTKVYHKIATKDFANKPVIFEEKSVVYIADQEIIKPVNSNKFQEIATQDLANKSAIPEEKSDVYIANQVLIKPVNVKNNQEIATKDFANKSVISEEKSDVYVTEKLIIKTVDNKKCQEMSTKDLFNKVIQTHSPMTELEVAIAETVKTEQQELPMKSTIPISEIEYDISENVINELDVVNDQRDWSVTPWEQPKSAIVMSMSPDYVCKGAVEFINFTDSTGSSEKEIWQKEIQRIIQNITLDAEEFANDLSDIPLPEVAPPEISVDEIPLPEESLAANDQKVSLLCSVEDVPGIDQLMSQQHLPTIFDYKSEAPVIAASNLPSSTPILRVDDTLLPLSLCDEYLVLTDVDIPCNRPTYFTLAPYNNVSRVIMDTLHTDHKVSGNNNSGPQISDENHNDIAVNYINHVRDNSIDEINENLYNDDKDTKESAEVMDNYNNNKENDNDLHIDSYNIVVIAKNDNNSTVNNNNTQEYDNNIGIRDRNEEEEENKTDDAIVNEVVPSGDEIIYEEVKSVDEFVNEGVASRDEFGNGGATSINEFVNEGITSDRDAYTNNVVLSALSSAAALRRLAASGALLLLFAASSGVTSLLRCLWLRGRLVLCGNVPADALRDLASQLNASCSSQLAPGFEREE